MALACPVATALDLCTRPPNQLIRTLHIRRRDLSSLMIRFVLCSVSLALGLIWFLKDWLGSGQFFGGLSYLVSSFGLCGIFALGFDGWKSTGKAYLIGVGAAMMSLLALFQEHPGASLDVMRQNQKTILLLSEIAQGTGDGQNASSQAMQMATSTLSGRGCASQNERNMLDFVIQAYPALYLEPEYSVVMRLIYGPSQPPENACARSIEELRRIQPELFPKEAK